MQGYDRVKGTVGTATDTRMTVDTRDFYQCEECDQRAFLLSVANGEPVVYCPTCDRAWHSADGAE
jgi:hypothetical protein